MSFPIISTLHKLPSEDMQSGSNNAQQAGPATPSQGFNQASLDLTFGVELECLVLLNTSPETADDADIDKTEGMSIVHDVLEKPLTAKCATCKKDHSFSIPVNTVGKGNDDPTYTRWSVDEDSVVVLRDETKDKFAETLQYAREFSVEIKSRVLQLNHNLQTTQVNGHAHEITWQEEIGAICRALEEGLNDSKTGRRDVRILVNDSCGLHVHVGNHDKGFPLPTLKNVLSICLANEKVIDSMHANSRITGSTLPTAERPRALRSIYKGQMITTYGEVFNVPWSMHMAHIVFVANHQPEDAAVSPKDSEQRYPNRKVAENADLEEAVRNYDVPSHLKVIQHAESVEDLTHLHGTYFHASTISLLNLKEYAPEGVDRVAHGNEKMTIEFRQHAGTLDLREMASWIEFLAALVTFSHTNSEACVRALCLQQWNSPKHTLDDLLDTLEAPKQARKHYRQVLGLRSKKDSWAGQLRAEESKNLHNYPPGAFANDIMADNIQDNARDRAPEVVKAKIEKKFLAGGYGQFVRDYLKRLKINDNLREKLIVGWKTPYRESETEYEDENEGESEEDDPLLASPPQQRLPMVQEEDEEDEDEDESKPLLNTHGVKRRSPDPYDGPRKRTGW